MKKFLTWKLFVFLSWIIVTGFFVYKHQTDTYVQERTYECKVLSKIDHQYDTHIKGVTHNHRDFILVLSSEGKQFSLDVSPTTWATCTEGQVLYFDIAPYELDYYNSSPIRWGAGVFVCVMLVLGYILWILIGWIMEVL